MFTSLLPYVRGCYAQEAFTIMETVRHFDSYRIWYGSSAFTSTREVCTPLSFNDITVPAQRPFNIMLTGDDIDFASKSDQSSWSRNVSKPRDWALFLWFQLSSPSALILKIHDDVIKWEQYPYYWSFVMCVRGIHRSGSPVNSPHKLVIGEFPTQTWQRTSNVASE